MFDTSIRIPCNRQVFTPNRQASLSNTYREFELSNRDGVARLSRIRNCPGKRPLTFALRAPGSLLVELPYVVGPAFGFTGHPWYSRCSVSTPQFWFPSLESFSTLPPNYWLTVTQAHRAEDLTPILAHRTSLRCRSQICKQQGCSRIW